MEDDDIVELTPATIRITRTGRLFLRNVAMLFDDHLNTSPITRPVYSRTV